MRTTIEIFLWLLDGLLLAWLIMLLWLVNNLNTPGCLT